MKEFVFRRRRLNIDCLRIRPMAIKQQPRMPQLPREVHYEMPVSAGIRQVLEYVARISNATLANLVITPVMQSLRARQLGLMVAKNGALTRDFKQASFGVKPMRQLGGFKA